MGAWVWWSFHDFWSEQPVSSGMRKKLHLARSMSTRAATDKCHAIRIYYKVFVCCGVGFLKCCAVSSLVWFWYRIRWRPHQYITARKCIFEQNWAAFSLSFGAFVASFMLCSLWAASLAFVLFVIGNFVSSVQVRFTSSSFNKKTPWTPLPSRKPNL